MNLMSLFENLKVNFWGQQIVKFTKLLFAKPQTLHVFGQLPENLSIALLSGSNFATQAAYKY